MAYDDSRVAVGSLLIRSGPVLALLLLAALLQLALPLSLAVPPGRCGDAVQCVPVTSALCAARISWGMLELVLRLTMRQFLYWYCA